MVTALHDLPRALYPQRQTSTTTTVAFSRTSRHIGGRRAIVPEDVLRARKLPSEDTAFRMLCGLKDEVAQ